MAKGIDCNYEINAESITLDFKNGNFSRVNFDEVISVAYEQNSDFNFKGPFISASIISVVMLIGPDVKRENMDYWLFILIFVLSTLMFGLVLSVLFFFGRSKRDDIILDTRGGKKIVFSVQREKGIDVVLEIRGKMRN